MKKIVIVLLLIATTVWALDSKFFVGKWKVTEYNKRTGTRTADAIFTEENVVITGENEMASATYRISKKQFCVTPDDEKKESCFKIIFQSDDIFFLPELDQKYERVK